MDPVAFVRSRTALLLTCRMIYFAVGDCDVLWGSYILSPHALHSELRETSWRFGASGLRLHLYLRLMHEIAPTPERATISTALAFLVEHAARCSVLRVTLRSSRSAPLVVDALERADFATLQSVTFVRTGAMLPAVLYSSPLRMPFSGEQLRGIRVLRMFDLTFAWLDIARFTGLAVLVIHQFNCDSIPTVDDLFSVFTALPLLSKLSVHSDVSSSPFRRIPNQIVLSHLSDLDISTPRYGSFPALLDVCLLPALTDLTVSSSSLDLDRVLEAILSRASSIQSFFPTGRISSARGALAILRRLPAVERLDLSSINAPLFKAALETGCRGEGDVCCPLLSSLSLTGYSKEHIVELVDARSSAGVLLQEVDCYDLVAAVHSSVADSLARADTFRRAQMMLRQLSVDAPRRRGPHWAAR